VRSFRTSRRCSNREIARLSTVLVRRPVTGDNKDPLPPSDCARNPGHSTTKAKMSLAGRCRSEKRRIVGMSLCCLLAQAE
jgi:hypothetical protein